MTRIAVAILFICLIIESKQSKAQGNEIIHSAYIAAGSHLAVKDVPGWRLREKKLIHSKVAELPDSVKSDLLAAADRSLEQAWPLILLSDYREFQENGNRTNFENLYFTRRTKLSTLCAGELVAGNGKYIPEIVNGLWLILQESTWVLPAHLTGEIGKRGPDPDNPRLDLFTAETAAQLAWINLLLGDKLISYSPPLVNQIQSEIESRVSRPYMASNEYWWMGFNNNRKQNNWNIWINSNVLKIAVLSTSDESHRNELINKVVRSADKFLDSYPLDGGCDEGPAYWSAAGGALGEFLSMLTRVSSGKMSWKENELIHNIGKYIYKVHIDKTRFVNFADAPGSTLPDPGRVYNFGEMFDDNQLKGFASYLASLNSSASGMLGASSINVFASNVRISKEMTSNPAKAPLLEQNWLPELQVLNLREQTGSTSGLSFMAKGGNNGESHNHNDVGNFMIYMDGSPVLIDLGKGTYTRQTFSPDRYKLWYTQSQWHNCPQINGIDQQAGTSFAASAVRYTPGKTREVFSMNLAGTYPKQAGVKSWQREFTYNRSAGSLVLKESYETLKDSIPTKISFIASRRPVKEKEGQIRLSSLAKEGVMMMYYDPKQFSLTIEEQLIDDGSLKGVWGETIYRIMLENVKPGLKNGHTVRFVTK